MRHGVCGDGAAADPTAQTVTVQSRLLGAWWTQVLGLGRNGYEQRLPDLVWDRPDADKWALLSGLWEGDGSWSLVNGGPSVILEMGTISAELADGVLRLLGDLGIVASQRIGRTREVHEGHPLAADQRRRSGRARDGARPGSRPPGVAASIARQRKRIAPTGSRRLDEDGPAWLRVVASDAPPVQRARLLARGSRHPHVRDHGRGHVTQLFSQGCERAQATRR